MNAVRNIGIYSFPKSGNTWLKHIVAHSLGMRTTDIPGLHGAGKLSNGTIVKGTRFYKSHSKVQVVRNEGKKFETQCVLHIRRNPLDVFVSYLNYVSQNYHDNASIPFGSVEELARTELMDVYLDAFIALGHVQNFPQTGSYYEHNRLWMERSNEGRVLCVRYEDILADPQAALSSLPDFIGLPEIDIAHGLEMAKTSTKKNSKFFWKQKEKNFQDFLSHGQIDRFLRYRSADCTLLGYDPDYFLK